MNGKVCWCCKSSESCECNAHACYECGACPMHCKCEEGFIACECEHHGDQAEARYYCRVHGPNGINDKRRKAQEAADNFAWAETMRGVFGDGA